MSTTTIEGDNENPQIKSSWLFNGDPTIPTSLISMFTNFSISSMFVYGITGKGNLAYLSAICTFPISAYLCYKSGTEDFERWVKMRQLREKNFPVKLMPYPYKFDWTEFEERKRQIKIGMKLKNAEILSGSSQNKIDTD